jgi:hypothetical protein
MCWFCGLRDRPTSLLWVHLRTQFTAIGRQEERVWRLIEAAVTKNISETVEGAGN